VGAESPFNLMLLSDQGREWMAYLDATHPFLGLFERRFLSFEMGQVDGNQLYEMGHDPICSRR
jgi:hypothetical protein